MGHIMYIRIYGLYDVCELSGTPSVYGSYCVCWDMSHMRVISESYVSHK